MGREWLQKLNLTNSNKERRPQAMCCERYSPGTGYPKVTANSSKTQHVEIKVRLNKSFNQSLWSWTNRISKFAIRLKENPQIWHAVLWIDQDLLRIRAILVLAIPARSDHNVTLLKARWTHWRLAAMSGKRLLVNQISTCFLEFWIELSWTCHTHTHLNTMLKQYGAISYFNARYDSCSPLFTTSRTI